MFKKKQQNFKSLEDVRTGKVKALLKIDTTSFILQSAMIPAKNYSGSQRLINATQKGYFSVQTFVRLFLIVLVFPYGSSTWWTANLCQHGGCSWP